MCQCDVLLLGASFPTTIKQWQDTVTAVNLAMRTEDMFAPHYRQLGFDENLEWKLSEF